MRHRRHLVIPVLLVRLARGILASLLSRIRRVASYILRLQAWPPLGKHERHRPSKPCVRQTRPSVLQQLDSSLTYRRPKAYRIGREWLIVTVVEGYHQVTHSPRGFSDGWFATYSDIHRHFLLPSLCFLCRAKGPKTQIDEGSERFSRNLYGKGFSG
ncbi:hypothetical protein BKA70DRAFT_193754 [Coprinopsis sp. MPI-PUGE-AT-0042]|nr:hypothetical protein BKA70DRAFT_193754 [Coprinopsis sp. MPI-PUGE-AT-0042]